MANLRKTATDIHLQRQRIFALNCRISMALAAKAHPATGGNKTLVHNWGNDAARAVWQRRDELDDKIRRATDVAYTDALHREHINQAGRFLWCAACAKIRKGQNHA